MQTPENSLSAYAITLTLRERKPVLGRLVVPEADGRPQPEKAFVEKSGLGADFEQTLLALPELFPELETVRCCIMPDRVHLLLRQKEALRLPINLMMTALKTASEEAVGNPLPWTDDCECRQLTGDGELSREAERIADRPYRLAMEQLGRGQLIIRRGERLAGGRYDCIGNMALRERPVRPVHIGSRLTDGEKRAGKNSCILDARQGAVLAGPFISPDEKDVMRVALREKLPVILLTAEAFPPGYEPGGELRKACLEGRMLMLNPWPERTGNQPITREQCLALNRMAEDLADQLI